MTPSKRFKHDDIIKSLTDAYNSMLKRKPVKYTGPLLTSSSLLSVSLNVDQKLKKYKYDIDEQNRTPLDIVLSCAFQLGIQQGVHLCIEKPGSYLEVEESDKKRFKRDIETALMTKEEVEQMFARLDDVFKEIKEAKTKKDK